MTPDCPVCKTNEHVARIPDCTTHAAGPDSYYYSDYFRCSCCGGELYYSEQRSTDKGFTMSIIYTHKNYDHKVVGE